MQGAKKKNYIGIAVLLLVVFAGILFIIIKNSGKENNTGETENTGKPDTTESSMEKAGYYFEFNGVEVGVDDPAESIIKALGEPIHYFEAQSCAFEGMDKIYTYSGFEFQTYTKDDKDYIYSVSFLDDSVATREGIALGASFEDVKKIYGENYENSFNQYSFTYNNCKLSFIIENGEVISIEYAKV